MKKTVTLLIITLLLTGVTLQGQAHHSFAMFDQTRKVTITGTITEIQWTNPHVWIHLDVPDEAGSMKNWGVEFTSRVHLIRRGFPRDDIKVGDTATFSVSPYANGDPGGRFYTLQIADGVTYCDPGARRAMDFCQQ